jgi:soluble lytic murein transglycosylase-like protein
LTVLKFITVLTFVGLVVSVSPAEAQIYSWRDSNGNLVLSDRKLSPNAKSFPILATSSVHTTKPVMAVRARYSYTDLIVQHAEDNQIRPDLVRAVIQVESAFNPRARSPKGAIGLMQLMPSTAAELGVTDPYDPGQNIRGGVAYLRRLLDRYDNNEELALAAYNAGPLAVDRHGSTVPPYRETRDYVKRIKGMTAVSASASAPASAISAGRALYKTIEIINGRPVPRYTDSKPASGEYEVLTLRQ